MFTMTVPFKKIALRIIPHRFLPYIQYILHNRRPTTAILDIAAVCNGQCPFCPRVYMPEERKKGFMKKSLFEKCLTELKAQGIKDVRLYATSEPTLHPDFDYIVKRLKDEGMKICVSTNGAFLDKHRDSLMIVDTLQLSLDGWDRASYEKLRYPLKFDDIREKVKTFYLAAAKEDVRPEISAHLLLTKKTDLIKYLDCWSPFVDKIKVSFLMGTTRFKGTKFITECPEDLKDYMYPFEIKKQKSCIYPFNVLTISFDGKISLCCADFSAELPLGNIVDGFHAVFYSSTLKNIRRSLLHGTPDVCFGCNMFFKPLNQDVAALHKTINELSHPQKNKLVVVV
jgi:MoaA/NifB/PqqE/SkfB family radical SAM enzyme